MEIDPEHAAEQGLALCREGRAKEAAAALEKLHMRKALSGRAKAVLAQAYFEVFRLRDAERLVADEALDNDALAVRLRAELALEHGRNDEAVAAAQHALSLDSTDARAQEILALLHAQPSGSVRREASLRSTLQRAAFTAIILAAIVLVYHWRVQAGEAAAALVKTARSDRDKMDKAALDRALKAVRESLAVTETDAALSLQSEIEALQAYEYGGPRPSEAIQRVLSIQTGERYFAEAMTYILSGAPTKAETLTTQVIKDGGVDARVYLALGLAEKALGRLPAAKDALRRGYELAPFHPLLLVELGDVFLLDGDARNADFYWRKAHEASPLFERAVQRLQGDPAATPTDAASQLLLAQASPTPERYEALSARFPGVEALVFAWARSAAAKGKVADAEAVLQRTPDVAATPRAQALLAELSVGDAKKSETYAKAALAADPKLPEGLFVMGRLAQLRGDHAKALEWYTKALEQRGQYPEVYHQVGLVFFDTGDLPKAREQLLVAERMFAKPPARLYEDLARVADKAGNAKEAAEWRARKR